MMGRISVGTRGWLVSVAFIGALVVHVQGGALVHNGTPTLRGAAPRADGITLRVGALARAEIGAGCASGARCGPQEVCRAGLCMEACEEDAMCLEGMYCLDGACVPDAVACLETAHCAPDRVCHEGMCLLPQCDSDSACAPGWVCAGQVCQDPDAPDVVPGTDVVSLKRRIRERYLGCASSGGGSPPGVAVIVLAVLGWLGRRRRAGAP